MSFLLKLGIGSHLIPYRGSFLPVSVLADRRYGLYDSCGIDIPLRYAEGVVDKVKGDLVCENAIVGTVSWVQFEEDNIVALLDFRIGNNLKKSDDPNKDQFYLSLFQGIEDLVIEYYKAEAMLVSGNPLTVNPYDYEIFLKSQEYVRLPGIDFYGKRLDRG